MSQTGAKVRLLREALQLTRQELADRVGASKSWIVDIERGKPSPTQTAVVGKG